MPKHLSRRPSTIPLSLVIMGSILLLSVGAVFSAISTVMTIYNTMVKAHVLMEQTLADLESVYQRRYALIDNFVSLVKETKAFEVYQINIEREIYAEVAYAKASATKLDLQIPEESSKRIGRESTLNNVLLQTLDKLLVMAQHYPTITDPVLKDRNQTFEALTGLKTSLVALEDQIQSYRQTLNASVRSYNQNILIFPANIFASGWGFTKVTGFEVLSEQARQDVQIAF